ncbi:MAG: OB-fold domain-containing protein [Proteobacteria bacterium]|nr:OB-fold domain-containing protein [Burkholderiales bacterium]
MPTTPLTTTRHAPHEGRLLRAVDVTTGADGGARLCAAECESCGTRIFPSAAVCPSCNAERLRPLALSERGTLYAYSTVHVAPAIWQTPYVIGYVDLPEGVRIFGKVDPADDLRPDMPVRIRIEAASDIAGAKDVTTTGSNAFHYWFTAR